MEDGLKTLEYEKVSQNKFPLYTQILVKLPKAPPTTEQPWSKSLKENLSEGMKLAVFGIKFAQTIAKGAIENDISFDNVEETNLLY